MLPFNGTGRNMSTENSTQNAVINETTVREEIAIITSDLIVSDSLLPMSNEDTNYRITTNS